MESGEDSVPIIPLTGENQIVGVGSRGRRTKPTNHKAWERALRLVYPSDSAPDSDNLVPQIISGT